MKKFIAASIVVFASCRAFAGEQNKIPIIETENGGEQQNWAIHFDAVEVLQGQPGFHSPYQGPQSLKSDDNFRQTGIANHRVNALKLHLA